jgi:hypothetical protein
MLRLRFAWPLRHVMPLSSLLLLFHSGCSPNSGSDVIPTPGSEAGDMCIPVVATGPATTSTGAATCASPGEATAGPEDTHCAKPDGGVMVQSTNQAACCVPGDAGGPGACPYDPTMYGHEGDDDDCKYHVAWTSSPVCEGAAGVQFTVTATYLGTGKPVTGANLRAEVFTTSPPNDAGCDDVSSHESPSTFGVFTESPEGTYGGRVVFDEKGAWTVRFHLFENCYDVRDDSPHGHAAFHVTVP